MNDTIIRSMEELGRAIDEKKEIQNCYFNEVGSITEWVPFDIDDCFRTASMYIEQENLRIKPEPELIYLNIYSIKGVLVSCLSDNHTSALSHASGWGEINHNGEVLVVAKEIELGDPQ